MSRDAFLAERRIAMLATADEDGSIYLTAVWYLWEDGAFLVPTDGTSRKAQNVAARSRASIVVDARGAALAGVAAAGATDILSGQEALELNDRIHRRYVTPAGMDDPHLGSLLRSGDDVTLRLVPDRWHRWDMEPAFGRRFGDPELAYPLAP